MDAISIGFLVVITITTTLLIFYIWQNVSWSIKWSKVPWEKGWDSIKAIALVLLTGAFLLLFLGCLFQIALWPVAKAIEQSPARTDMLDKKAQEAFEVGHIVQEYKLKGPIQNGWIDASSSTLTTYHWVGKAGEGPLVYSGMNVALTDRATLVTTMSGAKYTRRQRVYIGDGKVWTDLPDWKFELPISQWKWSGPLFIKAETESPLDELIVVTTELIEDNPNAVRIHYKTELAPGEVKEWGVLPDPQMYYWAFSLRVSQPNGLPHEPRVLETTQAAYQLDFPDQQGSEVRLIVQETTPETSHRLVQLEGEPYLGIRAPDIEGGSLVEVILRIEPRRWEPEND